MTPLFVDVEASECAESRDRDCAVAAQTAWQSQEVLEAGRPRHFEQAGVGQEGTVVFYTRVESALNVRT